MPQPLAHFNDQLLAAQQVLNPTLTEPIINSRALLLLSRPCGSVCLAEYEMLVLEFFGLYWVHGPLGAVGFFASQDDAIEYLKEMATGPA